MQVTSRIVKIMAIKCNNKIISLKILTDNRNQDHC